MTPRKASARLGVLLIASLLLLVTVADGATSIAYSGKTSQNRSISFTVSGRYVKSLQYHINDRCPDRKLLFVHNWGFTPMRVQHSKFGGKFMARAPQTATAIIAGTVAGKTISGSLSDRTKDHKTHKFCAGKATFRLTHR